MSKRLSIYEDATLPMGWVVISLEAPPSDQQDLTVRINRKQTDRTCLGPDGWQSVPHDFVPREVRAEAGRSHLIFGPELTEWLALDMRLGIDVPAAGISETHLWPEVTGAPAATDISVDLPTKPVDVRSTSDRVMYDDTSTHLEPSQTPEPEHGADDDEEDEKAEPAQAAGRGDEPRQGWSVWWLAGIAMLLVFFSAAGLWWYLNRNVVPDPLTETTPPEIATEPPAPDFRARYQDLREKGGHAAELLSLGREAIAAGASEIGFVAISLAADRNSPDATMVIAKWQDPFEDERLADLRPNAGNAALYYQRAASLGQPDGQAKLQRLCEAADEKAAAEPMVWSNFDKASFCQ